MRIGVDVDEVLAEFNNSFMSFVGEKTNKTFDKNAFTSYRLTESLQLPEEKIAELYFQYFDNPVSSKIEPVIQSIDIIKELAKEHELIIITARTTHHKAQTIQWLETHYPEIFKEIYFTNDDSEGTKGDIAVKHNIDIHIDDAMHNILHISEKGIPCLLFNRPWNQEELPENVKRVHSWEEIMHEINNVE